MELHTVGIDLGKTVFHLVGLNRAGEVVVRKKCSRVQLVRYTANMHVALIGMEACGGAHFLGKALRDQGHEVRLIPAQYVKPYVKTNKSDYMLHGVSDTPGARAVPGPAGGRSGVAHPARQSA
jgi:transposase